VAAEPDPVVKPAGVTVLQSAISSINASGLRYRGYAVEELATSATYEDVAWLLWNGERPALEQRAQLLADLGEGSAIPEPVTDLFGRLPPGSLPAARMQAALPLLALTRAGFAESGVPGDARQAARLLGAFATLAGGAARDATPVPVRDLPHDAGVAGRFLTAMRGSVPAEEEARAFEEVLILYADHELNASTFAGRVAASTRADLVSCVLAALSTLRGQLHGGIDRLVRAMIAAAEQEGPESVVERYIRADSHLPGFGHAVYRSIDPRAVLMRELGRQLAPAAGLQPMLEMTDAIAAVAEWRRLPPPNVDLYTAVVYRSLGIPDQLSTLVFATARMAGWTAHILEQYRDNRLIRPRADYIGAGPRAWSPA